MHNENIPSIEYNYWMSKLKVKLLISYESVHICQEKRKLQQRITTCMFTLE